MQGFIVATSAAINQITCDHANVGVCVILIDEVDCRINSFRRIVAGDGIVGAEMQIGKPDGLHYSILASD